MRALGEAERLADGALRVYVTSRTSCTPRCSTTSACGRRSSGRCEGSRDGTTWGSSWRSRGRAVGGRRHRSRGVPNRAGGADQRRPPSRAPRSCVSGSIPTGRALVLTVEDDGAGIDVAETEMRGRRGLGMIGMRERVAELRGTISGPEGRRGGRARCPTAAARRGPGTAGRGRPRRRAARPGQGGP